MDKAWYTVSMDVKIPGKYFIIILYILQWHLRFFMYFIILSCFNMYTLCIIIYHIHCFTFLTRYVPR